MDNETLGDIWNEIGPMSDDEKLDSFGMLCAEAAENQALPQERRNLWLEAACLLAVRGTEQAKPGDPQRFMEVLREIGLPV